MKTISGELLPGKKAQKSVNGPHMEDYFRNGLPQTTLGSHWIAGVGLQFGKLSSHLETYVPKQNAIHLQNSKIIGHDCVSKLPLTSKI